jgi:hypothetical protein
LSSTPAKGFRVTFIAFGLGLLFSIPLIFLMPDGRYVSPGPKKMLVEHY